MVKRLNKKGGFTSDSHSMKHNVNSSVVKAATITSPSFFKPPVSEEHSTPALTMADIEKALSSKYIPIKHGSGKRKMKGGNLYLSDYASVNEEVGNVHPNNDWTPKIGESAAPIGESNSNNGDWGSAKNEAGIYTPGSDWAYALGENPAITTQMGAGKKTKKQKKTNLKKGGNATLDYIAKASGNIIVPSQEWAKSVGENVYPPFDESKGGAKDKKKPKTVKPKTVKPKTVKPKTVKPKTVKPKTVKPKTVKPKTVKPKTLKPKVVKKKTVKKD